MRDAISPERKIEALKKIRAALSRGERPVLRSLGLSERELAALVDENLFEFTYASADPRWEDCRVEQIYPKGLAMLPDHETSTRPSNSLRPEPKRARLVWICLVLALLAAGAWYLLRPFTGL